jgi:hypothetical protein
VSPVPPSPTAVNDDLLKPLLSESFTNDAARGTATVLSTGLVQGAAQPTTVSVEFDAATGNYTVTRSGRQQTFRPADRNVAQSSPALDVYVRTAGNVTDSLSLTTPSQVGAGGYRYVGGGVWQETTGTTGGSVNVFTYGVETPDADVPRAGTASYQVKLLGVAAWQQAVTALSGTGNLGVNFATGAISGQGQASETDATTLAPAGGGDWSLTANLAGATNHIDGTFKLYPTSVFDISGPFSGRFYGPAAVELGGVFSISGADSLHGPGAATGLLLGYRSSDTGLNASFADLKYPQTFGARGEGLFFKYDQATGKVETTVGYMPNIFSDDLTYDPATQRYTAGGMNGLFSPVTLSTGEPSLTNARFVAFSGQSGAFKDTLQQYRYAADNPELQLTYASFAHVTVTTPETFGGTTYTRVTDFWPVYGFIDDAGKVPTSGTADYSGVLYGSAIDGIDSNVLQSVDGTVFLAFDFGRSKLDGDFHFFVTDAGGTRRDFGDILVAGGTIASAGLAYPEFRGNLGDGVQGNTGGPQDLGLTFFGNFYGPAAKEVAGSFSGRYAPVGSNAFSGYIYGAFGAKKTP